MDADCFSSLDLNLAFYETSCKKTSTVHSCIQYVILPLFITLAFKEPPLKIYNVGNSEIEGLQRFLYRGAAKLVPLFSLRDLFFFLEEDTLIFDNFWERGCGF